MRDEALLGGMRWCDMRLIASTAVFFVVISAVFCGLAEHKKPVKDFIFERLPQVTGIYRCCDAGGRYSKSWVGSIGVNCSPFGYYAFLGTNRNDCGLKEKIDGRRVTVVRLLMPSFFEDSPIVAMILLDGNVIYELPDRKIRELWIRESINGAFGFGFLLSLVFYFFGYVYLDKNFKSDNK